MLWLLPGVPLAGVALIVAIGLTACAREHDRGEALGQRDGSPPVRGRLSARLQFDYGRRSPAWRMRISNRPRAVMAASVCALPLITLALALTAGAAGWTGRYAWSPAFALEAALTPAAAVAAAVAPAAALIMLVYAALRAPQQALLPFLTATSGCLAAVELLAASANWLPRLLGCELGMASVLALSIAVRRWRAQRIRSAAAVPNGLPAAAPDALPAGRRSQRFLQRFELVNTFRRSAVRAISTMTRSAAKLDERIVDGAVRAAGTALQSASAKAGSAEAAIDRCIQRPARWAGQAGAGLSRAEAAVGRSYYTAGALAAAALAYAAALLLLVFSR